MKFGDTISVVIITYNSCLTIIEALNSIKEQNYVNIELIISDDCSTDSTKKIIDSWCKKNKSRFKEIKKNYSPKNQGTSFNINNGMKLATSEWVKVLAGDDVLLKNCISDNVNYVTNNYCKGIIYSKLLYFVDTEQGRIYKKENKYDLYYVNKIASKEAEEQYKLLLKRDILLSPSGFFNINVFKEIGGFETKIPLIEDWPYRLKMTRYGYKIYFLNKTTVLYRQSNSVSRKIDNMFNEEHLKRVKELKKIYCYPNISSWNLIYYYEEILIKLKEYIIVIYMSNKLNIINKLINIFFNLLIPSKWRKIIYIFNKK